MTKNAEELVSAGGGFVAVAEVGTAFPSDMTSILTDGVLDPTKLAAGWVDLGYTTDAGVRPTFDRTTKKIGGWPSFDPLRTLVTEIPKKVEFDLLQWNADSMRLALGGGDIEVVSGGFIYVPPASSFIDVKSLILGLTDGERNYLFGYHRTQNTKALTFSTSLTDVSPLTIGMDVLAPPEGVDEAYFFLTDDPAFNDIGS